MACETERVLIENQIKTLLKNNRVETKDKKKFRLNPKEGFNFGYKSYCKTSHEQQINERCDAFSYF